MKNCWRVFIALLFSVQIVVTQRKFQPAVWADEIDQEERETNQSVDTDSEAGIINNKVLSRKNDAGLEEKITSSVLTLENRQEEIVQGTSYVKS